MSTSNPAACATPDAVSALLAALQCRAGIKQSAASLQRNPQQSQSLFIPAEAAAALANISLHSSAACQQIAETSAAVTSLLDLMFLSRPAVQHDTAAARQGASAALAVLCSIASSEPAAHLLLAHPEVVVQNIAQLQPSVLIHQKTKWRQAAAAAVLCCLFSHDAQQVALHLQANNAVPLFVTTVARCWASVRIGQPGYTKTPSMQDGVWKMIASKHTQQVLSATADLPGAFASLADMLQQGHNVSDQTAAASFLQHIFADCQHAAVAVLQTPSLVKGLANLLQSSDVAAARAGTGALCALAACSSAAQQAIAAVPGVMSGLVRVLHTSDSSFHMPALAARTLGLLASADAEDVRQLVTTTEGIAEGLAELLVPGTAAAGLAAWALHCLCKAFMRPASSAKHNAANGIADSSNDAQRSVLQQLQRIAMTPGLLKGLAGLMQEQHNATGVASLVATAAVTALCCVCRANLPAVAAAAAETQGMLDALAALLVSTGPAAFAAAAAIAELAQVQEAAKQLIGTPQIMQGLLGMLSHQQKLAAPAACTLQTLVSKLGSTAAAAVVQAEGIRRIVTFLQESCLLHQPQEATAAVAAKVLMQVTLYGGPAVQAEVQKACAALPAATDSSSHALDWLEAASSDSCMTDVSPHGQTKSKSEKRLLLGETAQLTPLGCAPQPQTCATSMPNIAKVGSHKQVQSASSEHMCSHQTLRQQQMLGAGSRHSSESSFAPLQSSSNTAVVATKPMAGAAVGSKRPFCQMNVASPDGSNGVAVPPYRQQTIQYSAASSCSASKPPIQPRKSSKQQTTKLQLQQQTRCVQQKTEWSQHQLAVAAAVASANQSCASDTAAFASMLGQQHCHEVTTMQEGSRAVTAAVASCQSSSSAVPANITTAAAPMLPHEQNAIQVDAICVLHTAAAAATQPWMQQGIKQVELPYQPQQQINQMAGSKHGDLLEQMIAELQQYQQELEFMKRVLTK